GHESRRRRQEGHQDVVASIDGDSRDGGTYPRGAQREEVHPGVHHREHGRPQARRVRADQDLQGPHHEGGRASGRRRRRRAGRTGGACTGGRRIGGEGGRRRSEARRRRERAMIEAHATARYVRTSAQKAGLVLDLIRGKDVNRALATLKYTRKGIADDISKVLRSAIANAQNKEGFSGDVDRLFVSACYANQGPAAKRVRPAPMGRALRGRKRTPHLTVHGAERPEKVVALGTTAAAEAPRPKRARALKSATTPSKKEKAAKAKERGKE